MDETFECRNVLEKYLGNDTFVCIPKSICAIGKKAFEGNCNITEVIIPEGVTTIEDFAFYGCENLKTVKLPNSITYIGESAFEDCWNLTCINVPEHVKLGSSAFSHCYELADKNGFVIVNGTLYDTTIESSTVLQIPDGVKYINDFAEFPSDIKRLIMPSSLKAIGDYVFDGRYDLETVSLPRSLYSIGEGTFMGCYSLKSINIPAICHVGDNSFDGCYSLADSLGRIIVNGVFFESGPKSSPTLTIPEGVYRISAMADVWQEVETIILPKSLKSIGKGAFFSCDNLKSINFPRPIEILDWNEIKICDY